MAQRVPNDVTRVAAISPPPARVQSGIASVEDLIAYTVEITGVRRERLLSKSRRRYLTLPRAFITFHGRALGFTLAEIADRLERHQSSLLQAVDRSLLLYPHLFRSDVTLALRNRDTAALRGIFVRPWPPASSGT